MTGTTNGLVLTPDTTHAWILTTINTPTTNTTTLTVIRLADVAGDSAAV